MLYNCLDTFYVCINNHENLDFFSDVVLNKYVLNE